MFEALLWSDVRCEMQTVFWHYAGCGAKYMGRDGKTGNARTIPANEGQPTVRMVRLAPLQILRGFSSPPLSSLPLIFLFLFHPPLTPFHSIHPLYVISHPPFSN